MRRYIIIFFLLLAYGSKAYSQESGILSVITTKDEVDLTDITLVTIPTQGPFMLAGNEMLSLDDNNKATSIAFPEEMYIEDIIWTGADFAIKSRNEIYMLNDVETPIFVFGEEEFKIFPWDDQRIFIVYHEEGQDIVYYGNLMHKRTKRLIAFDEEVVYITALGDETMIVTTTNIYLFTKEECVRFMNFWTPVHTAVMTSKGLFFATEGETCLLTGVDNFILLFDSGCKQLLYDSKDLYILTNNSDLVKCNIEKLGH